MKKKLLLLLISFIAFYTMVHAIRYLPGLMHGRLNWQGENTLILSVVRIVADMAISYLFALLPYLLLYYFYPDKKFSKLILWIIVTLAGCLMLSFLWIRWMETVPVRLSSYLPAAAFLYILYTVFGMAFYFIRYAQYTELQQKEIALQSRQSELSFLRSQINPHFLFNNLNSIYSLVYHHSEQALPAISGLSDMLRYMLYDTSEKVALEKEVVYIEKYIELQKLRFEQEINIGFRLAGNNHLILIHPLLLLPFVENAFKHGDLNGNRSGIAISLVTNDQKISFCCSNCKSNHQHDGGGGIGIENVRKRLKLLYPGKYHLDIVDDADQFTVNLDIFYAE